MKLIEYGNGMVNLNSGYFFEVTAKRDSKDVISCWLEGPGRDLFLFSCESEEDAKKFKKIFFNKLYDFYMDKERNTMNLSIAIHDTIEELLGG